MTAGAAAIRGTAVDATDTRRLARGSLRFLGAVGMSIGIQAPTGGLVFIPALMAATVGEVGPLAFLLAVVAMLPVALVIAAFSRRYATAGSVYAFNGGTLSPVIGFATCLVLFLVYVLYAAACAAGLANVALALTGDLGWNPSWLLPALVAWAAAWYFCFRSIHFSALFILTLEGLSLSVIAIVGIVVIAKGGYGGHNLTLSPFQAHGIALNTLLVGLALAYTGFSGFEGAATTGEEARLPRRVIPLAVVASLVFSGLAYTFGAYIEQIGYSSADALGAADVPMVTVATTYMASWVGTLVNVAALLSLFGGVLACMNAASRLLFALARDGFVHRGLAAVHSKQRSPFVAVAVVAVLAVISMLALTETAPLDVFFYLAQLGVYMILVVYLLTCAAGVVLAVRERAPLVGGIGAIGIGVLGVVIKYQVSPWPAFPFDWLLVIGAGLIAVAVALPLLSAPLRRSVAASQLFRLTPAGADEEVATAA